jgi:hypothetical protein
MFVIAGVYFLPVEEFGRANNPFVLCDQLTNERVISDQSVPIDPGTMAEIRFGGGVRSILKLFV